MANVYSLLIGVLVVALLVILIYLSTITREVGSWITWCYNIKHIRSLPSPPGHWIWGHIAEVKIKTLSMYTVRYRHRSYYYLYSQCHSDACFPGESVSRTRIPRDACVPAHISLGMRVSHQ